MKRKKEKIVSFRITKDLFDFLYKKSEKEYKSITQVLIDMMVEKRNEEKK